MRFLRSLCEGAFCAGIFGHYGPVSSGREAFLSWEEALFPPAGRREWTDGRSTLSSPLVRWWVTGRNSSGRYSRAW